MSERLAHDHPSVETVRATLARRGRGSRPRLVLPDDAERFPLNTIRLVLGGATYHARIETGLDGDREISGAYDNPRLARERDGTDRLDEWRSAAGIDPGRSVAVDVVEPSYLYGVREPGARAVYEATEPPDEGLAAIARDLDGDRDR